MNARTDPVSLPLHKRPFTWLLLFFAACAAVGFILRAAGCAGPPPKQDDPKAEWQGDPLLAPDANEKFKAKMREAEAQGLLKWDTRGALVKVNETLLEHPDNPEAYHFRGRIVFDLSQYDRAIENYDKAIALWEKLLLTEGITEPQVRYRKSQIAEALSDRGYTRWVLGRLPESLQDHDDAIAWIDFVDSKKTKFSFYYRRGRARQDARVWDKAIADFEQAIEMDPGTHDRRVFQDLSLIYRSCPAEALRDPLKARDYEERYLKR